MSKQSFSKAGFILLLFIAGQQAGVAQCPAPAESMNFILSVEDRSDEPADPAKQLPYYQKKISRLSYWHQLLSQCKADKDSIYARLLHRLGGYYIQIGDYEKGIYYSKEAIAINGANNPGAQRSFLVNSYYNLGFSYSQLNLHSQARIYLDSCIELGAKYPEKIVLSLNAREKQAFSFFKTGDYEKSILTAQKGILLAEKTNDTALVALLSSQKAQAHIHMGQTQQAEEDIKEAIRLLQKINAPPGNLAPAYSIYAALLAKKKEINKAISYYRKAISLNLRQNNWLQCCRDMMDLGGLYDNVLNDFSHALDCYQQGINFLKKTNDSYELAGLYNNMGSTYSKQKNYRKALYYYQKGLNTLPIQFRDTSLQSNPSPEMLKQITNDYYISIFLTNKGEALLNQYGTEKNKALLTYALKAFEAADNAVDQMRSNQYNEPSKLFWRQKTKKMYQNAIEVCYLLNDIKKAFYFFEKSRAVLLNDKLGELGAKKNLSPSELLKEQDLKNKVFFLRNKLSAMQETSPYYNETLQQLLTVREDWEKFIKNLEKKYPVYYQYKYENKVPPLDSVYASLLRNRQSLVEYFTGDTVLYILSLTHANSQSKLIRVPVKDYSDKAKELLALSADRNLLNQNYPRYCSLAFQLYSILFQPLNIPKGRTIISPDEHFIPFEALLSQKENKNSFLVKDYAFSYTYSAGFVLRNVPQSHPAENMFLGIAPVDYQAYLKQPTLEGADLSLGEIKKHYRLAGFLVKEKATRRQFLANLPLYRIVQLYSHADADSSGKEPVLYLSDSVIHLSEIQNLVNVKTEMIVLSACNTGVGKNARGEGIFSFARAFTAAGIPSTLTTLWKIDNRTTYKLTELFYEYLSQGIPKDVALQKAKLKFLESGDVKNQMPYFWAANILLGKTDAFTAEKTGNRYVIYITAFGFILVLMLLLKWIQRSLKVSRKPQPATPALFPQAEVE